MILGRNYKSNAALTVTIAVGSIFCSANSSIAAASKPVSLKPPSAIALSSLEQRLFRHVYAADGDDIRLARLEKLVFGDAGAAIASTDERIAKLFASASSAVALAPLQDPVFSVQSKAEVAEKLRRMPSTSQVSVPKIAIFDTGTPQTYPRVTTLESLIVGKTYAQEPVGERINRVESKVFGKTAETDGLLQRIERIEAKEHVENIHLLMENPDILTVESLTSYLGHPLASPERYAHLQQVGTTLPNWITAMEEHVLGQAYPQEPLLERISALEIKLFSAPNKDIGLLQRWHQICSQLEPEPVAVASVDEQGLQPRDVASNPISSFQVPINPEMSKPADPSVDGFQLPVNPTLGKQASIASDGKETFSTVKSKSSVFHKFGKALQVAGVAFAGPLLQTDDDILY